MGRGRKKRKEQYKRKQAERLAEMDDELSKIQVRQETAELQKYNSCASKPSNNPVKLFSLKDTVMNSLVKIKDKLYTKIAVGPWEANLPVEIPELKEHQHRWVGKKIPLSLWRQIIAFLKWSYDETKAETLVHLYYHAVHGWAAIVLPQEGYNGMTIKMMRDHPDFESSRLKLREIWGENAIDEVLEDGTITGIDMGTVHHHCSGGAFQSGTDHKDETDKEGLHITIGNLDSKEKYSMHARATCIYKAVKSISDVNIFDWFEVNEQALTILPLALHKAYFDLILISPVGDVEFPEFWKKNVIKRVYNQGTAYNRNTYGCGQIGQSNTSNTPTSHERPTSSVASHNYKGYGGRSGGWLFQKGIKELCHNWGVSLEEVKDILTAFKEEPLQALINEMVDEDTRVNVALIVLEELIKKEKEEQEKEFAKAATEFNQEQANQAAQSQGTVYDTEGFGMIG
jgi:hypothetical protein